MKHTIWILAALLLSPVAGASPEIFAGKFSGKGTYILDGDMTQCGGFEMVFSASKSTFTFVSGNRNCDKHSEQFYPVTMQYKNNLLYFNGKVVGGYDGSTLHAFYRMPDGNSFRNWRMFMRREGKHVMYEESRTMDGEVTPLISFAGLLIEEP